MDRDRSDRIVNLEHALDVFDAQADQHPGRKADDHRADRIDEAARRRDGDQAG